MNISLANVFFSRALVVAPGEEFGAAQTTRTSTGAAAREADTFVHGRPFWLAATLVFSPVETSGRLRTRTVFRK